MLACILLTALFVLQMLGMHGTVFANFAVDEADLLLAFGVRFDDRVTGKLETFASKARVVHIDIDPAEISKNKEAHVMVCSDTRPAIKGQLLDGCECALLYKSGGCNQAVSCVETLVLRSPVKTVKSCMSSKVRCKHIWYDPSTAERPYVPWLHSELGSY